MTMIALKPTTPEPLVPISYPASLGWYCVYTRAKAEFRVRAELVADGFEAFVPVEKRWVKHARRREVRQRPLFPSYLFVAFDPNREERWHSRITLIEGVHDLLCDDQLFGMDLARIPLRVPESEIIKLKRKEAAGEFDYTQSTCAFSVGQAVKVASGPFVGFDGIVHATPPNKRVEVLLDLLKRKTVVKLEASELEKA